MDPTLSLLARLLTSRENELVVKGASNSELLKVKRKIEADPAIQKLLMLIAINIELQERRDGKT